MADTTRTRSTVNLLPMKPAPALRPAFYRRKAQCVATFRGVTLTFLFFLLIVLRVSLAAAADPLVEIDPQDEANGASVAPLSTAEAQVQSLFPVLISLAARTGYDSNSTTTGNSQGSGFASQQLTLSYDRLRGPTQISAVAGTGVVERFGQKTDINAFLNLTFTHSISPRLSLTGGIDSAYQAEPDFTANVGPTQRSGNYFRSGEQVSAAYEWSDRFSTVTSYLFRLVRYEDSFTASFTDREEYTFGEEFR
ncbi:MAG: hypothetical protein ABIR29_10120, partial [Chthoniobacterales bacterium]